MGDRITLKMIEGTLETISELTGLTFELSGKNVYNTSNGSYSKYCYGITKAILYGKLQAIKEHCYDMQRLVL